MLMAEVGAKVLAREMMSELLTYLCIFVLIKFHVLTWTACPFALGTFFKSPTHDKLVIMIGTKTKA
jgi:hypothetical protein